MPVFPVISLINELLPLPVAPRIATIALVAVGEPAVVGEAQDVLSMALRFRHGTTQRKESEEL